MRVTEVASIFIKSRATAKERVIWIVPLPIPFMVSKPVPSTCGKKSEIAAKALPPEKGIITDLVRFAHILSLLNRVMKTREVAAESKPTAAELARRSGGNFDDPGLKREELLCAKEEHSEGVGHNDCD